MRYFRQLLIFVCILGLTSNLIFAQNTEEEEKKEEELPVYAWEEIVVTESKYKVPTVSTIATKVPVPIRLTPASIGVVNHGLFQHQSGVVLGDALRNVSWVNIQTVFGVTDFFVNRAFDSVSSGLVLTDGASEPEATFYNLYNLERVEVLNGAGGIFIRGQSAFWIGESESQTTDFYKCVPGRGFLRSVQDRTRTSRCKLGGCRSGYCFARQCTTAGI